MYHGTVKEFNIYWCSTLGHMIHAKQRDLDFAIKAIIKALVEAPDAAVP